MASNKQIKEVMRRLAKQCRDPLTNEMNHTLLAERAAEELNLYVGSNYEIPEMVFELAADFE